MNFRFGFTKEIKGNKTDKPWGLITSLNLVNIYATRKKNHGFWTKCGFEINKEIKGNEAKK